MPLEIERKFLVKGNWEQIVKDSRELHVKQGYLSKNSSSTVRVRTMNSRAFLTVKGKTKGISRAEFEYEIPLIEAEEMLELCTGAIIEKSRYFISYKGKTWELDVFKGDNEGLVIAEIELGSEDEKFEMPEWAGDEVSHDKRYSNSSLSQNPFKNWEK